MIAFSNRNLSKNTLRNASLRTAIRRTQRRMQAALCSCDEAEKVTAPLCKKEVFLEIIATDVRVLITLQNGNFVTKTADVNQKYASVIQFKTVSAFKNILSAKLSVADALNRKLLDFYGEKAPIAAIYRLFLYLEAFRTTKRTYTRNFGGKKPPMHTNNKKSSGAIYCWNKLRRSKKCKNTLNSATEQN